MKLFDDHSREKNNDMHLIYCGTDAGHYERGNGRAALIADADSISLFFISCVEPGLDPGRFVTRVILNAGLVPKPRDNGSSALSDAS